MSSKYKPGIYFGIFILIINLAILKISHPEAFEKGHLLPMIVSILIGSIIGGLVFGLTWNWVKKRQTDN